MSHNCIAEVPPLQEKMQAEMAEGWEYAPLFNMKFHHKERKMDLVRRRRWHRKMVCEDPKAPCYFQFDNSATDSDQVSLEMSHKSWSFSQ